MKVPFVVRREDYGIWGIWRVLGLFAVVEEVPWRLPLETWPDAQRSLDSNDRYLWG